MTATPTIADLDFLRSLDTPTVCNLLAGGQVCCPGETTCINGACQTCVTTPAPDPVVPPRRRRRRRKHN